MGVEPSTAALDTHQWPHPQKEVSYLPWSCRLLLCKAWCLKLTCPIYARISVGLILCIPRAGDHSCCHFICLTAMFRRFSQHSFPSASSYISFFLLSCYTPNTSVVGYLMQIFNLELGTKSLIFSSSYSCVSPLPAVQCQTFLWPDLRASQVCGYKLTHL